MKITIETGQFCKAIVTDADDVKTPCINDKEVLREVKMFLSLIKRQ